MARRSSSEMISSRRLSPVFRALLIAGCLLPSARAGILAPEWSRPLTSPVISAAARPAEDGTEELFFLLADRRVMVVSRFDTLTEIGRAPEGTTALVALPCVGAGAGVPLEAACEAHAALLLADRPRGASGSCNIIAWNRRGQQLWRAAAPDLHGVDSLVFVGCYEDRAELCAWQRGEPWLVIAGHEEVRATRLNPDFIPLDALIMDLDRDRAPEFVFFDGWRLAVHHPHQGSEFRCQWPAAPLPGGSEAVGPFSKPLIAGAVFDSTPVLLVLTGDTLRYLDALTGAEKRRLAPDPSSGLPGYPRAVCGFGSTAYVAGVDGLGRSYIAALSSKGPAQPRLFLQLPSRVLIYALALLKDWPMLLVSTGYGPENLLICTPGLAGAADNSPGYSGARLLRVLPLRIDGDTFPDLVVLRTAADARWRVDVFSNRLGLLTRELEQARQALQHAALGRNENEVRRAVRRMRALSLATGSDPVAPGQETRALDRFRLAARRRNTITYAGALVAFCLAAGLVALAVFIARRRRAGPSGQQIEDQPLPARVALAADLIAVDHNFISKGNTPAAIERLIETRNRHGLARDRDLARLTLTSAIPGPILRDVYTSAIARLIDSTPTLPMLDFVKTTARSAPRGRDAETLEFSREEYRQRERAPGVKLISIANHEYPDCYRRFRLFANPELRGTLEHIILDHIRHAGTWADITLTYTVNTQWNRCLFIRLLSDSLHAIPLHDRRAHITSQLPNSRSCSARQSKSNERANRRPAPTKNSGSESPTTSQYSKKPGPGFQLLDSRPATPYTLSIDQNPAARLWLNQ
jgi:hypothetical protein